MNLWRLGRLGGGEKITINRKPWRGPERSDNTGLTIFLDFEGMQCPLPLRDKQVGALRGGPAGMG